MNQTLTDGVIQTQLKYQPHEGILYAQKTQVNEDIILSSNVEKQKQEQRKMEWGRQVASIPELVYSGWLKQYPELRGNDRQAKDRTLLRLIRENPQYMVVEARKV